MADETTTETVEAEVKETKKPAGPRPISELLAKDPTEAQVSLSRWINDHVEDDKHKITPEQAASVLILHSRWQGSPEREAEREALKVEREEAKARKAEELAAKKAERERAAKEKAERAAAKKAAKEAEENDSDSDLDAIDDADEGDAPQQPRRRRRKAAVTEE